MSHQDDMSLERIIQKGESNTVEFKESFRHLEKEICAFANAQGGTIYIGISDDGAIVPITLTNRLKSQLQNMAQSCDPSPDIQIKKMGQVVALHVYESSIKPVKAPGGFYLRKGSNSQKLNRDEIFKFAIEEGAISFDGQIYTKQEAATLLSLRKLERFRQITQLEKDLENAKLLQNLSCLVHKNNSDYLTYAGILLFGENPQQIFSQATLTMLYMQDEATILEQKIIKGTLFDQIEDGFSFIKSHLSSRPKIEGLYREDVLELPEFVIRELLVNAIVHRDYLESAADIMVKIFQDKIEFSNPGVPPKDIALSKLYGHSYRRNKIIADIFYRSQLIERAGTGLLRVKNKLAESGLKPIAMRREGPYFVVNLPRPVPQDGLLHINERQRQCLKEPKTFFPFSTHDYAKRFDVSLRTAGLDIKELTEKGYIKKIRHGRNIAYEILK